MEARSRICRGTIQFGGTGTLAFQMGGTIQVTMSGRVLAVVDSRRRFRACCLGSRSCRVWPKLPPDMLYNCACVFALSGRTEKAIAILKKLRDNGYFDKADNLNNLRTDKDLDSLRRRDDFVKLVSGLNKNTKPTTDYTDIADKKRK